MKYFNQKLCITWAGLDGIHRNAAWFISSSDQLGPDNCEFQFDVGDLIVLRNLNHSHCHDYRVSGESIALILSTNKIDDECISTHVLCETSNGLSVIEFNFVYLENLKIKNNLTHTQIADYLDFKIDTISKVKSRV